MSLFSFLDGFFKQPWKLEGEFGYDMNYVSYLKQNALNPSRNGPWHQLHVLAHLCSYKCDTFCILWVICVTRLFAGSLFCRTARWRSLVAGAVAGPSLLLTGHKKRHTSMALYILVRAAVLAARCGIKNERTGWLCRPLSWRHGDTFLMCLSSSQIL